VGYAYPAIKNCRAELKGKEHQPTKPHPEQRLSGSSIESPTALRQPVPTASGEERA
jgi:hypothetical protein